MEFASSYIYADIDAVHEEIYEDEVKDGIAHAAKEQAEAWAIAAKEEGNESTFVRELLSLTQDYLKKKGAAARAGEMGTMSRLQPRYQKGKAQAYDSVVANKVKRECAARVEMSARLRVEHEKVEQEEQQRLERLGLTTEEIMAEISLAALHGTTSSPLHEDEAAKPVVIELGSQMSKVGFAGDEYPRAVFPSVVGRARHHGVMCGMGQKDAYIGDEAQSKRGVLTLNRVIDHGLINNWDGAEKLLHHCFYNELRICPEDHPVLITDSPLATASYRERLVQTMFETFNTPAVHIVSKPVLALFASGRTTGLTIHIGDSGTLVVPTYEGFALPHAVRHNNVGGREVTAFLQHIMSERGYSFTTTSERDIVQDLKQKLGFVALDFEAAMADAAAGGAERSYELPDGQVIHLGNERFRCAEVLLSPFFAGIEAPGAVELAFQAIMACDCAIRKDLYGNIVLSGGTTMFRGFAQRLEKDLAALAPSSMKLRVVSIPEHTYASWAGGSALASLSTFSDVAITRDMYDDMGPGIVHRKCCEGGYSLSSEAAAIMAELKEPLSSLSEKATDLRCKAEDGIELKDKSVQNNSSKVVAKQPLADTNSVLIRAGWIIKEGARVAEEEACCDSSPCFCDECGAILHKGTCVPCQGLMSIKNSPQSQTRHFMLQAPPKQVEGMARLTPLLPSAPMIVFCVDTSGSMSTCVSSADNLSRLECMQQAVIAQIEALVAQQPQCTAALLNFHCHVEVSLGNGSTTSITGRTLDDLNALLEHGQALRDNCKTPIVRSAPALTSRVNKLHPNGATALGPAMAFAVGIAGAVRGSRVVVFTDGLANMGVGKIQASKSSPFYTELAKSAADMGVSVSVLTVEGEDCSMENLGTAADMTGGQVDIVDPSVMKARVKSVLEKAPVASAVECTLVLPRGLRAQQDGLPAMRNLKIGCGVATDETDLTARFSCESSLVDRLMHRADDAQGWHIVDEISDATENQVGVANAKEVDAAQCVPSMALGEEESDRFLGVQVQLRYTLPNGAVMLSSIDSCQKMCTDRSEVEGRLSSTVSALSAIHHAAQLAQKGLYHEARLQLISMQRLLQRAMRTPKHQKDYLSFVVEAEKLDQFMREVQEHERVFGIRTATARQERRDDEASKAMFQMKSVSSAVFHARE